MTQTLGSKWSELVSYPGGDRGASVPALVAAIIREASYAADDLGPLLTFLEDEGVAALEELFVRTFENNSERALEVGWHLHGENYARGSFMARMRELLRELGIEETVELPDHLSHMLLMLDATDSATAKAMANGVVLPALDKIEEGFNDSENPYIGVIRGLQGFITHAYLQPTQEGTCNE